jgi:maleamate amidohydrolase
MPKADPLNIDKLMKNLENDYQQAGFGTRIGFGARPALILVDFQKAYLTPSSPMYSEEAATPMQAALDAALRIREVAHRAGVPVFLTQVEATEREMESLLMYRKSKGITLFDESGPYAGFADGLTPEPRDIVIRKLYPSGFFGTALTPMLVGLKVDSLIITGLSTSGCVRATCTDAVSYGFTPLVVRDGVADRHPKPHEANLFDMGQKYADIVSEAEVDAYLGALARNRG